MVLSRQKAKQIKRKLRTFTDEDLGTALIQDLERTDPPADGPAEKLVGLMERLRSGEDTRDEMVDLINQTNTAWAFAFTPVASRTSDRAVTVEDRPLSNGEASPEQRAEWNRALVLLKHGNLDRVRRCAKEDCKKLFWARFAHAEYHSDACRIAVEVGNPEYKENRREYMRSQRKAQKRHKKGGK